MEFQIHHWEHGGVTGEAEVLINTDHIVSAKLEAKQYEGQKATVTIVTVTSLCSAEEGSDVYWLTADAYQILKDIAPPAEIRIMNPTFRIDAPDFSWVPKEKKD